MSGTDSLCNFFNATWLKFTGRTMEEELGVGWAEGVFFEDFQCCMDTYERAFGAREPFEMEYRLRRADGEYRWVLDRGVPRLLPDGTFAGYIGSCVDITEHKALESHLRRSIRDREDFLSIASHELRTPLTALQLALEKLERDIHKVDTSSGAPPLARTLEKALSQTARLEELVADLLDVSRVTSGRLDLALETVDLAALARGGVERLSDAARKQCSELILDAPAPVVGSWDRSRLERVISNLLSNALKYGDGKPVHVTVSSDARVATLAVRDEGIGIEALDQARIFERFERAVSARNYSGFGLGLWIVREIVRAHGGTIGVESAPGKGATFRVELPLPAPDRAASGG
jgi:PAS domain S-box-containing protein